MTVSVSVIIGELIRHWVERFPDWNIGVGAWSGFMGNNPTVLDIDLHISIRFRVSQLYISNSGHK